MNIRIGSAGSWGVSHRLLGDRLTLQLAGALAIYAALLVLAYAFRWWFIDAAGNPFATDFVFLWSGGHVVTEGGTVNVYDWEALRQVEFEVLGRPIPGYFPWLHPPMFLMVAALFALVPYILSWMLWDSLTALFCVWAILRIHKRPSSMLVALAAPASLWCAMIGQDGFLTTGLLAGTLAYLETSPILAGVFLGLLTYKPHFGLLFPLVLFATGRWRTLASATATTLAFAGLSLLVLGAETWRRFFDSLSKTTDFLLAGGPRWTMLQSVYALTHEATGSDAIAWGVHVSTVLGVASILVWAWRQPISYNVKAALLAAAALLVPPYVFAHDAVALVLPAVFLNKEGLERGFLRGDKAAISISLVLIVVCLVLDTSAAIPIACALLFMTALRRLKTELAPGSPVPSVAS